MNKKFIIHGNKLTNVIIFAVNFYTMSNDPKRKIIEAYDDVLKELGTLSIYVGKMHLYFLTSEKCNYSVSHVRQTLSKYFNGEIKIK